MQKIGFGLASILALAFLAATARAGSVDILVGDKDGFGFITPCTDTGSCAGLSAPSIDNRDLGEIGATNGSQFTDVYSSLFPGNGPNGSSTADILFPFAGTLTSATLSFAAGDFQSDVFGAFSASIDGISIPFFYADGRFVTAIHSITLTSSELAAANLAHELDLHLDRNGSGDFVAFDWFELTGTNGSATPEPGSLLLLGTGFLVVGFALYRRNA